MKKTVKKLALVAMSAVMAVAMCFAFVACGETKEPAKITGAYTSSSYTFASMYPATTFKMLVNNVQVINTYDDNTYQLTVTSKTLSGGLAFVPSNTGDQTADATDRGQSVAIYMGTYTATETEGLLTLTLNTPTAYIYNGVGGAFGNGTFNTLNWTDAMGEATATDGVNGTAEAYLATVAFKPVTVTVDLSTGGFSYANLSVN